MNLLNYNNEKGSTLLVTTMVVMSISVLVLISLGISSRNLITTSQNFKDAQFAFYAVEGAMNETLQHVSNDSNWPASANYTDSYSFDGVEIDRSIVSSLGAITYEITGMYNGVYRKLRVIDDQVNDTLTFEEVVP